MSWGIKIDKADKVFSQWIRLRDRECRRCHSPVRLNEKGLPISHQASHFKGRRKEATRFEPLNVDTLCGGCHAYFTENPAEHEAWQVQMKGQKIVDQLILLSNTYKKKDRELEYLYWKQELSTVVKQRR
jgi:nitrate/TMAO reductase-like tetraheme cytochrome c subunit